jgi:hypothetical protein
VNSTLVSHTHKLSLAAATLALAVVTALSLSGGNAQGAIVGCTPATNIEAIIDDSGSMSGSDSNELRRTGLEIFIKADVNKARTLGAVEFGSDAATVFAPLNIGANKGTMVNALAALIDANNGGTDYDSGFIKAFQDNRTANARIFLTDGANNGTYNNTHRNGPRTYVVGLGIGAPGSDPDANRLQQIANETKGFYFPGVTAATLQPTFNAIISAISCVAAPQAFTSRLFTAAGQTSGATARLARSTKKADLVLNWAQPTNNFSFSAVQALGRKNKVLADLKGRGKRKKLRVNKDSGATFRSLTVRKPKGTRKLRFKVRANRVTTPEVTLTQLTQR